jgi:hypothetical protein
MARIAEDLLLLLLDNPDAQPALDRVRLSRVLAAALILDLAYECRVRPAQPHDPVPAGDLIALAGAVPLDPAVRPALTMFQQGPLSARSAISRLRKRSEDDVLDQLLRSGELHQIQLSSHRLRRNTYAWPLQDRIRVDQIRAAALAALFGPQRPDPATAAVIALLYRVGALATALHLNDEASQGAAQRAEAIAAGGWVDGSKTDEVNLAVTAAAVLPALN